jgi:LmbE family N-acetylglucosaminyl deacetylase
VTEKLKLMCVLAHPDDESLGMGGTLAKYGSEGIQTYLLTATRGERGRFGDNSNRPSDEVVGETREKELREAADKLGVGKLRFLDYIDGDLSLADPVEATAKIVAHIREDRPHVVVTFGPEGGYGHPDHIAICQFTTAATICAADCDYQGAAGIKVPGRPHRVDKLYYMAWGEKKWAAYQEAFKDLKSIVDSVERRVAPVKDWIITTVIDTSEYWEKVWEAVLCHKTQLAIYSKLKNLPEKHHRAIWGIQEFYRVFSAVNGGKTKETDLFEGLRR